ncbi:MAG: SWF/SNF helicase family protein, partial [Synergistaceae bacterium]|nr:SWF/SNF helicase family protein [Synergistaceae bacterium]
ICNHPAQYLGEDSYKASDSGKFEMLRAICETIHEKREKVIVFTQFKEIIQYITAYMEEIFHAKGLVIHGGIAPAKRTEIIDKFNNEDTHNPFMILSLKAGGVGLNLARANHVIHFDRWWNPAIENQATDRAFRIGQSKNVFVHKFVTKGTIEDRINDILESKKSLADSIITNSADGRWITEMSNDEILSMMRLV